MWTNQESDYIRREYRLHVHLPATMKDINKLIIVKFVFMTR